jgi:sterol desaturase/sphingolipid hydroxylase (fatty acid hydroxylase superfamily)
MPPAILYYAIPGFLLLLILESWFSYREKKEFYEVHDTWSNLAMGVGNLASNLITKALIFGVFTLLYRWRLFTLDGSRWWHWALAFFADDLTYYWFHRCSHQVSWFWASHVVHHSSRKYNLSAALRQTWTGNLTGAWLFWCWMPLIGFHPVIVLMMQSVSLIYQFWIHTEAIRQLPRPVEFLFNTPSHHRVHHGVDLKYLDRNHGGILIVWDRMFGTFRKEEERPEYGLTRNIGSFNPFVVAFRTWAELFGKASRSGSFSNFIRYFTRPPGWSHDGSTRTTRELLEEYNRSHPESPIR